MDGEGGLHQAAPAVAQRQSSTPVQPRVFGKLKFPKHVHIRHTRYRRFSDVRGGERDPVKRRTKKLPNKVQQ